MGLIRLLLAFSVVIAHAGPLFGLTLVGGKMAVQSFFIVSGFYMALILHEKYVGTYGSYKLYITNRLLRIFPLYWFIFFITCVFLVLFSDGLQTLLHIATSYHPLTIIFLIFTNMFIFGQDLGMFLGRTNDGLLFFSTAYEGTTPFVYMHLLVPQGWTLAVELSFYFLAPFLVKRNLWMLAAIACGSIVLRLFLYSQGLHHEPWTNRFFPTELVFFVLGIISYRLSRGLTNKRTNKQLPQFIIPLFLLLICFTLFFSFLPKIIGSIDVFQWLYYLCLTISLPFLFAYFQKNHTDAFFGELAYPVFVSHFFIIIVLRIVMPQASNFTVVVTVVVTLLFSMALLKLTEPINQFRQKRAKLDLRK